MLAEFLGTLGVGTDLTESKLESVAAQAFPATELELLPEEREPLPFVQTRDRTS